MKMDFFMGLRILYTIFISNVFYGINCGRINNRELQSYSRNCHNGTCDHELSVAMATRKGTAEGSSTLTPDLMKEVMRLKVSTIKCFNDFDFFMFLQTKRAFGCL